MPVAVIRTVEIRELLINDVIVKVGDLLGHPLCGRVVESVRTKTKLAHIKVVGEPVRTVPLDTLVEVKRQMLTDEENAERWRAYALRYINLALEDFEGSVASAKAKLFDVMPYRSDYWCHYAADYAATQVTQNLWTSVRRAAEAGTLNGIDYFEVGDLVSATLAVVEEVKDSLLQDRFDSRSTSVIRNAFEDVERSAKAKWVRNLKFHVACIQRSGRS